MHFTEGELRQYERLMQEKPGFNRRPAKTMKERECKKCLYFDENYHKCSKEKCPIFVD